MRKQYHSRILDGRHLIWDVDRLIELARDLPVEALPLEQIGEIDEPYWFGGDAPPTCRLIIEHASLIAAADLAYPILISPDGRIMDGMHRVAQAALRGQATIAARRFAVLPPPDHVDVAIDSLPYD